MSARILAIANQKGGVGKTTTTLTLSAALARQGYKVLVLDMDPHASASVHLRFYPENLQSTVLDLFDAELAATAWERVRYRPDGLAFDFVPGNIRLAELEIDLKSRKNRGLILKKELECIRAEYDYIVLDCPPHIGIVLVNALVSADLLIIPIQTDFLALHGLRLLFDTVRMLNRVLPQPVTYRALATMYDRRAGACRRVLHLLRKKMQGNMFETHIDLDTKFREASAQGKVIYDLYPDSRAALEYESLAREIATL